MYCIVIEILDWISSSDWMSYVHWIDGWCEEINFKLGAHRNSQLLEIQNISVDESESDHKQRKKRYFNYININIYYFILFYFFIYKNGFKSTNRMGSITRRYIIIKIRI